MRQVAYFRLPPGAGVARLGGDEAAVSLNGTYCAQADEVEVEELSLPPRTGVVLVVSSEVLRAPRPGITRE